MSSPLRAAAALSERLTLEAALTEALDALAVELSDASVVFAFVSPKTEGDPGIVARRIRDRFGGAVVCGCSGDGVIAGGLERERKPALGLLAIALPEKARARPLRIEAGANTLEAGDAPRGVVLLADPFSCDVEAMLGAFDAANPGVSLVGGLASGGQQPNENRLFVDGAIFDDGAVGVAFEGDVTLDAVVAQGCKPIGEPMIVVRAEGPRILELDRGKPLDVLRDTYDALDGPDRERMQKALFCGVQMREGQLEYHPGDFLIRNVVGVEKDRGALVVASRFEGYPVVQLHVRDAETSAADLRTHLETYREAHGDAACALLFSCLGRGEHLYGEPDHDSRLLFEALGPLPVAGFFGNGEIGPVHGATHLHGYTSAFGLLRAVSSG